MARSVAIVGAGVSGLTCGVLFAERGFAVNIFAEQAGTQTTSGAAAALWFPYDAEPADKVIPWALATYQVLADLCDNNPSVLARELDGFKPLSLQTGVSMIELRQYCRIGSIEVPNWAHNLGGVATALRGGGHNFSDGFSLRVPLMDTTIYLDYLANRFQKAGGEIKAGVRFDKIDDVDPESDLVINCAGIGARELARDADLEPHRGQVAIVPKPDNLKCGIVCDDAPLMYMIPRTNDCVFGGTNDVSDDLTADPGTTKAIVAECSRVLEIEKPRVLRERVGLRPFRKSGVRLEKEKLRDGRTVIHNYGHGGSGFTLSWGCAENVFQLSSASK
ncbi:MAG TPA: FAD-dependent oxidoreductase [Chthoniobacterales bacterium]|jgi:D-amino-acid oxidase|nr:FAD-dependent oxidoreductase [Chthoniobacterales bacterium]